MMGALLVAPIILVWSSPQRTHFRRSWPELVALGAVVIAVSAVIFFSERRRFQGRQHHSCCRTSSSGADLGVLRFGQRGALTATLAVSTIATAGTWLGHGPLRSR